MSALTVGVPKEIKTAEHRVAMTPDGVRELENNGVEVFIEAGAGRDSAIADSDYVAAGATIVPGAEDAWAQQMVVKVKEPQESEFALLRDDLTLVTYLHLAAYPDVAKALLSAGTTSDRLRDRAARRWRAAVARADERGRGSPRHPGGRPLPRAPERRPRRPPRRGARGSARPCGRARRRQRRMELGMDRRRHGGRGDAARQEPRPPSLRRPDPPRAHRDPRVEPRRGRARCRRGRPRDRRGARRRAARPGRGE